MSSAFKPQVTDRDIKFLRSAQALATIWSKDPSSQVAALAVGASPNLVAWGYNGFPPGIADTPERLADRDTKLRLTRHAEPNALSNATFPVASLYVTRHPCAGCAIHILAERTVRWVFYVRHQDFEERWAASCAESRALFEEAGVELIGVDID